MSAPNSPTELFNLLLSELSASGGEPINASTDFAKFPNKTLREAVENVYWKNTALLNLKDRPRPVGVADDLYGHVLSLRVETLQVLALLTALCEAAHVDVNAVLSAVKTAVQVDPPTTPSDSSTLS